MAKKKDDNDDFDSYLDKFLDSQMKDATKNAKVFKGARHVYSTGLLPLDLNINPEHPGLIGGNIIQLAGRGHSGKTTMALSIAKQHMDQGYKVTYLDPEQGLTDEMILDWGYYKNHPLFKYIRYPIKPEEGGNYHRYFTTANGVLMGLQGENTPHIIIVDSLTYLRPVKETYEAGPRVGGNNQYVNEWLKSFVPLLGNTNALAIFINGVYADQKNQYNDYCIPGGYDLERACELIMVHYQRANDTSPTCPPFEKTYVDVTKNFAKAYKQKLGLKILKNKFHHTVAKQSAMDFFLTTDPSFDNGFGLDNTRAMLVFLKDNGVITHVHGGYYALGEDKRLWKDWEHGVNNVETDFNTIVSAVRSTFAKLNNGEV